MQPESKKLLKAVAPLLCFLLSMLSLPGLQSASICKLVNVALCYVTVALGYGHSGFEDLGNSLQ